VRPPLHHARAAQATPVFAQSRARSRYAARRRDRRKGRWATSLCPGHSVVAVSASREISTKCRRGRPTGAKLLRISRPVEIGRVISATLDTSCAANFLSIDEEPDEHLIEVMSLAFAGRVQVNVSEEAFREVELTPDAAARERRLARLTAFGRLEIPARLVGERDDLAEKLHADLFPDAKPGSRRDEHNIRDCKQLATHRLIGRELFITLDQRLLRDAEKAARYGITVVAPADVVERVNAAAVAAGLPSYPTISVRDADLDRDESDMVTTIRASTAG
jgi:hypothetical protein